MKISCIGIAIGLCVASFTGCRKASQVDMVYYCHYDELEDSALRGTGLSEYDSIRFSDGSWAVYRLRYSPQNSLVAFFHADGRPMATWSQASECLPQYQVYGYDEKGRLAHLITLNNGDIEDEETKYKDWFAPDSTIFLTFRNRINAIDYARPDTSAYRQMNIIYDDEGDVVEVCTVPGGERIVAPERYKLHVKVQPCWTFWGSDIRGGLFVVKCAMQPKDPEMKTYVKKHYFDGVLALEESYNEGRLVKAVMYPEPSWSDSVVTIKEFQQEGPEHIYITRFSDTPETVRAVWKNGVLKNRQRISPYGTVLSQTSYLYHPHSEEVTEKEERIDYRTKQLVSKGVRVVSRSELGKERDEMDLLEQSFYWENYRD